MNFWSSESQQVHLIGRVVTKVNEVKNVNDLSYVVVRSAVERWLQTGRKGYPFWEKGAWFLGVRAILSWAHPPGHFRQCKGITFWKCVGGLWQVSIEEFQKSCGISVTLVHWWLK